MTSASEIAINPSYTISSSDGRNRSIVSASVGTMRYPRAGQCGKNWGWVSFQNFYSPQTFRYDGIDPATGKMIYSLVPMKAATFRRLETDDPRSRWQAQLGVRFRF